MPPAVIYEVEYFSEQCFITSSIRDCDQRDRTQDQYWPLSVDEVRDIHGRILSSQTKCFVQIVENWYVIFTCHSLVYMCNTKYIAKPIWILMICDEENPSSCIEFYSLVNVSLFQLSAQWTHVWQSSLLHIEWYHNSLCQKELGVMRSKRTAHGNQFGEVLQSPREHSKSVSLGQWTKMSYCLRAMNRTCCK